MTKYFRFQPISQAIYPTVVIVAGMIISATPEGSFPDLIIGGDDIAKRFQFSPKHGFG